MSRFVRATSLLTALKFIKYPQRTAEGAAESTAVEGATMELWVPRAQLREQELQLLVPRAQLRACTEPSS